MFESWSRLKETMFFFKNRKSPYSCAVFISCALRNVGNANPLKGMANEMHALPILPCLSSVREDERLHKIERVSPSQASVSSPSPLLIHRPFPFFPLSHFDSRSYLPTPSPSSSSSMSSAIDRSSEACIFEIVFHFADTGFPFAGSLNHTSG